MRAAGDSAHRLTIALPRSSGRGFEHHNDDGPHPRYIGLLEYANGKDISRLSDTSAMWTPLLPLSSELRRGERQALGAATGVLLAIVAVDRRPTPSSGSADTPSSSRSATG